MKKASFAVFYLTGGPTDFVSNAMFGNYPLEVAEKHVLRLRKAGHIAMYVNQSHINMIDGVFIGGLCSHTDFEHPGQAQEHWAYISTLYGNNKPWQKFEHHDKV